jgi:hypothetical protein
VTSCPPSRTGSTGGGQDTRPNLAEILSGWKADYTGIDVDTVLVAGPPRDTVAATSTEAQLLVVGSPYRGRERTRWIRSVALAVLNRATCPVAVIPQQHPGLPTPDWGFLPSRTPGQPAVRIANVARQLATSPMITT